VDSNSKDVPCNTCIYFAVEQGECPACHGAGKLKPTKPTEDWVDCMACNGKGQEVPRYLNMTVCNRSNDMIWGMLGANAVHFSMLQEYLACRLGLAVGVYNQFTNNLHVYTKNWKPEEWLREGNPPYYTGQDYPHSVNVEHTPLIIDPMLTHQTFDEEVHAFVEGGYEDRPLKLWWKERFFQDVAYPMRMAFHSHKRRAYSQAADWCNRIKAPDWGQACTQWIERRERGYRERETSGRQSLLAD
jgi:hypothetical protein